jgi:glycosyltransferase involved in cell wall biosynthesis
MNGTESPAPRPRMSVIIPAYNEEKYLGDTLESVNKGIEEYRHSHGHSVEVIVVNNNSADRTEEVARAHGAAVVFEGRNQISVAMNVGAKAARGEILVISFADDHPSPNFLSLIDDAMSSGTYIGGAAKIVWDKSSPSVAFFNALGNGLRRVLGVSNNLLFTSRETFDTIGGFDERYYAGEDMKFATDLKRQGKREGKKFCVLTDGYLLKSTRKFDQFGGLTLALGLVVFLFCPWLVRYKNACFFWYSGKR